MKKELGLSRPTKVLSRQEVPPTGSFDGTRDLQWRVYNMLATTVSRAGFLPPQDRPTVVLSLACGQATDTPALGAFFSGGSFREPVQGGATVFAVDDNPIAIEQA